MHAKIIQTYKNNLQINYIKLMKSGRLEIDVYLFLI